MPKYVLFLVALIWTGIVSYFCLVSSNEIPSVNIPNLDKYVHVLFHFTLTFFWFLFFCKHLEKATVLKPLLYSVVFSFVFGMAIEMLQESLTTTRNADVFDILANTFGALLAVSVATICHRWNVLNSILKK